MGKNEPQDWGRTGRVQTVQRSYAMYEEVVVDGQRQIGIVWQKGYIWKAGLWDVPHSPIAGEPFGHFDDAVRWLLEKAAPEVLEEELAAEERDNGEAINPQRD